MPCHTCLSSSYYFLANLEPRIAVKLLHESLVSATGNKVQSLQTFITNLGSLTCARAQRPEGELWKQQAGTWLHLRREARMWQ